MPTRLGRNLRYKWNKSFILNVQANHACSCHQIWDPFSKMCHDIFCSTDQVHMSHNIPGSIQENWTWNALESFDHTYEVKSFLSKATISQVLEQFVCKGNHRNTTKEGSWLDMTWKKHILDLNIFRTQSNISQQRHLHQHDPWAWGYRYQHDYGWCLEGISANARKVASYMPKISKGAKPVSCLEAGQWRHDSSRPIPWREGEKCRIFSHCDLLAKVIFSNRTKKARADYDETMRRQV